MPQKIDFTIDNLGKCTIDSPVRTRRFIDDSERILYEISLDSFRKLRKMEGDPLNIETAGPRAKIYFDPSKTRAGIVTCGGLCPGINDVIRGIVMTLWYVYGVQNIHGFRYGYQGLVPSYCHKPMDLTPKVVEDIHKEGGSILSSSRGPQETGAMVDTLERMNVSILFAIGGDGTQRGALALHNELKKRRLKIAVVGIPKTIDNDLCFIEKSFGFETAFGAAADATRGAHEEATGAPNGVVVVKLMGRQSGFITANAALAMNDVNIVLVPEVPFKLEGRGGLFKFVEERLRTRNHAFILVAEGAGQDIMAEEAKKKGTDASGNVRLGDIGRFLVDKMDAYFKSIKMESNIKYIDPSYIIRSVPANPSDSVYCMQLAQNAAHAAMAGKTGMVVGQWNNTFTHVPIAMATMKRNTIDPDGALWQNVLESTGQPERFV
jgi:6-phosphofructokinase 1